MKTIKSRKLSSKTLKALIENQIKKSKSLNEAIQGRQPGAPLFEAYDDEVTGLSPRAAAEIRQILADELNFPKVDSHEFEAALDGLLLRIEDAFAETIDELKSAAETDDDFDLEDEQF